jgi:hypothetical protein
MNVILEIPIRDYHLCLSRLPLNSPEYHILQNGVVERNETGDEVVHILCDQSSAQAILKLFAIHCPEVLDRIRQLPANDRS